ncbi:MAG: hypothetical protein HY527_07080 [Betaproteobacteria bacterium]|nr:hypothetical protein [Betaproteobacteria bacterium]
MSQLTEPMSGVRGSAAYKREMAVEFAYRALATALRRAGHGVKGAGARQ